MYNIMMNLRVLFYNTFLRHRYVFLKDSQVCRVKRIIEKFNNMDYDIIGLCEVFDYKCLEIIKNRCKEKYKVITRSDKFLGSYNSGLVLLINKKLKSHIIYKNELIYSKSSYPDKLLPKGVLHVRVGLCNKIYNILVTHVQANHKPKDYKYHNNIRESQYNELDSYIKSLHNKNILLMGDFNTHTFEEISKFLGLLNVDRPIPDIPTYDKKNTLAYDLNGKEGFFFDNIIHYPNSRYSVYTLKSYIYNDKDLSDHYPVYSEIII